MNIILQGIIFSLFGGLLIAIQNVFNARLSSNIGQWETTMVVHFTGFLFSLLVVWFMGTGDLRAMTSINKLYLTGGVLGVFIVFATMMGILSLGASYSIAIVVITQLAVSTLIDTFGLFDSPQIPLNPSRIIGLIIMILGVLVFQFGSK